LQASGTQSADGGYGLFVFAGLFTACRSSGGARRLSYPELPADTLAGKNLERKRICRTFSDCTTAPRNSLPSGCYPLDPYYKQRPEAEELKQVKQEIKG
jgi:hypothetical protein